MLQNMGSCLLFFLIFNDKIFGFLWHAILDALAESKFDDRLGPHVRRYAYSYLLFDPCTYKLLSQGSSTTERVIVWFLMPVLRRLIYRGLGCNKPGKREQSLQAVETMFKEVWLGFFKCFLCELCWFMIFYGDDSEFFVEILLFCRIVNIHWKFLMLVIFIRWMVRWLTGDPTSVDQSLLQLI